MNDIVSMRYIRPCEPGVEASVVLLELEPGALAAGTSWGRGVASGGAFDDFFFGGTPPSLAHESR